MRSKLISNVFLAILTGLMLAAGPMANVLCACRCKTHEAKKEEAPVSKCSHCHSHSKSSPDSQDKTLSPNKSPSPCCCAHPIQNAVSIEASSLAGGPDYAPPGPHTFVNFQVPLLVTKRWLDRDHSPPPGKPLYLLVCSFLL